MSRRQRAAVQPEQTIAPQIVFDKSHMVCVRSADGQFFLLDRNCAMVSGVLRRFLQRKGCEEEPCTVVTATATIATTTSTTTNTTTPAAAAAVTLPVLPSLSSPPPESCDLTRIGTETYETIILEEIRSDLLELAIQAMYFKYRYDGEPEKRPLEVHHSAEMRHRLAAVSVLLDM
ncbi:uncharacterized protein TM35_000162970 [Trypanosoma theileri]|uniref:Elongin-C n=1 Tax=Trypanosoma theileri TaxID=67003 RepID=A0A1X0NWS9_9TRYP|nr:uncharacterized protein TM35_000162970 [Trypanosoma theileri]ORC88659.1 hypothetical protein TM35_000162970 [Trypanosoma theileri]